MSSSARLEHAIEPPRRWSLEEELALSSSPVLGVDLASPSSLRARSPVGVRSLASASDVIVPQRSALSPYAPSPLRSSLPVPRDSAPASSTPHAHSVSPIGRSPLDYHVPPTPASSYDLFTTDPPEWLEFFQPPQSRNLATSPGSSHSKVTASYPPQERHRERSVSASAVRHSALAHSPYATSPAAPTVTARAVSPTWPSSSSPSQKYAAAFGSSVYPSLAETSRRGAEGPSGGWMDEWLQGMGGLELDARTPASPPRATTASHSLFVSEPFSTSAPHGSRSPAFAYSTASAPAYAPYEDTASSLPYPAAPAGRGRGRRASTHESYYPSSSPPPPRRAPHYASSQGHYAASASRSYGSTDYGSASSSVPVMAPRHSHHRGYTAPHAMSPPHAHSSTRTGRSPQRIAREEHAAGHAHGQGGGYAAALDNGNSSKRRTSAPARENEDPSRFDVVMERVLSGQDRRTTLMIKNIPNKYDQRMLLEKLDERYSRLYDFFYLPIDFKNKCNVGYAFINFIDYTTIASFYEDFNLRKWDRFNSEKVCRLAYARIQGKLAFIEHFRNSSLMYEDESCRPLIFFSSGPSQGLIEPFPEPTVPLRPPLSALAADADARREHDAERDAADTAF